MPELQLILVDLPPQLIRAWKKHFKGLPNVVIRRQMFQAVKEPWDCMVSPANSFGLMDGGIDAAITKYFGVQLMNRVQE